VVFTVVTGGYDVLRQPAVLDREHFDYVCLTDRHLLRRLHKSTVWRELRFIGGGGSSQRLARLAKIHPHVFFPSYEWSIFVDANIVIRGDLMEVIRRMEGDVALFRHPRRGCVYEEAEACIRLGKDSPEVIEAQMNRYREQRYPPGMGLVASYLLVRRHNEEPVQQLMTAWWEELRKGSRRDQLSFDYCVWKLGQSYVSIAEDLGISQSSLIDIRPHMRCRSFRQILRLDRRRRKQAPGDRA
jgi:hypothetical protein